MNRLSARRRSSCLCISNWTGKLPSQSAHIAVSRMSGGNIKATAIKAGNRMIKQEGRTTPMMIVHRGFCSTCDLGRTYKRRMLWQWKIATNRSLLTLSGQQAQSATKAKCSSGKRIRTHGRSSRLLMRIYLINFLSRQEGISLARPVGSPPAPIPQPKVTVRPARRPDAGAGV